MKLVTVLICFGAMLAVYANQAQNTEEQQASQSGGLTDSLEESVDSISSFNTGFPTHDSDDEIDETLSFEDTDDYDDYESYDYDESDDGVNGEDFDFSD